LQPIKRKDIMESFEILWKTALPEIEKAVTSAAFGTFVSRLTPVDLLGDKIILCTSSKLIADAVRSQHTGERIREALRKSNSVVTDFSVVIAADREEYLATTDNTEREKPENIVGTPINPKFTFDSFVVGSSNEYIYAAAKAVAEAPADAYNPLFIYGNTGLGKTHILMAIANYLKVNNPSKSVVYVTCEQFTNHFIDSLGKGQGNGVDFRKAYRGVDVLLIDDIQFLAKKQGIQTEFFHTFNELISQNKQVVLASDRPPKEIEVLEERLRTRFEGGLVADVQPPELETRIAILRRKAEEQKCIVDIKVLTYLAEMAGDDIRTLIGKLTKVIFASRLHDLPISIELMQDALKESAGEVDKEELQAEDIINCVCNYYKVNKADVTGKRRNKEFVEPRQVCMYLISDMMSLPTDTIGQKLGGKDHATVIYSRDKIAEQMRIDSKLAVAINDIKSMLLKQ